MIYYVVSENPDDRILEKASELLMEGGVIALPLDTTWALAADPESKKGMELLCEIKNVDRVKHFSLVCNTISQASHYARIADAAFRKMHKLLPGPYTFIFEPTRQLPRILKEYKKEKQIGIRIPRSKLCARLIEAHEGPIVTTTIWPTMLGLEISPKEILSYQIEDCLTNVEMILDPGEFALEGESSVVDFSSPDGVPQVLRIGSGDLSEFGI